MKRIISLLLILIIILFSFAGCSGEEKYILEILALDTDVKITLYCDKDTFKKVSSKLEDELRTLEDEFSISGKGDIAKINKSNGKETEVSLDTFELIKNSIEISKKTDGLFDMSILPLVQLWGFDTKKFKVPNQDDINNVKELVDYKKINVKDNKVSLDKDMRIDLGGIAKGYIANKLKDTIINNKIENAVINLGGNIYTIGDKFGDRYIIGVQDPNDSSKYFATVKMANLSAVTSGAYQRYFEKDGVKYHHIIDPNTGYSADTDISSITIFGVDSVICDGYSTALFIMGKDKAISFCEENQIDYVILDKDEKTVYASKNISKDLKIVEEYMNKLELIVGK